MKNDIIESKTRDVILHLISENSPEIVPIKQLSIGIIALNSLIEKAKQDILLYLNEIDSDLAFSLTEAAKRGCKVSVATMDNTQDLASKLIKGAMRGCKVYDDNTPIKKFLYNYGVNVYSLKEELYTNTFCVVDSCRYTLYREDVKDGIFCAYDLEICNCLNTIFRAGIL